MTRTKKKIYSNIGLEDAQKASELFAVTSNKLSGIEARMNDEINAVKSKYQDDINRCSDDLKEPQQILEVFATEQQKNWGKKKSFELLHSTIGFRTGTPKVTKKKGFTWDAVTEIVAKIFPDLVRTKSELDKDAIIALRDEDSFREIKDQCFIDVEQDETFYIIPKKEEIPAA